MAHISDLSSATQIKSGDVLAFDRSSQTLKIDYNVLAKCIIEQYASSSLGGSAQSVKTALDAVISKQWTVFSNTSTLTSQADALANNSVYFGYCDAYGHVSDTDVPVNSNYYIQVDRRNASYITMFIVSVSNPANHQYVRVKNNGTWGEWVKQPTRAEMDRLKKEVVAFTFYDERAENWSTSANEQTRITKSGGVCVASINIKILKALTASQNSVISLTDTSFASAIMTRSVLYNVTKGVVYNANLSPTGNLNISHGGNIAVGDNIVGQIVWTVA